MSSVTATDRKRAVGLIALAGAALVSAVLGVISLATDRAASRPAPRDEIFLTGLAGASGAITSVTVESKAGAITAEADAAGVWRIASRDSYPANIETVRSLIVSASQLRLIEQRTADPARHAQLSLGAPPEGNGRRVIFRNKAGEVLGAFIAGKVEQLASGPSLGTLFVRRDGENQTWLAQGGLSLTTATAAWLDRSLLETSSTSIAAMDIAPAGLAPYRIARTAPGEPFALTPLPAGKEALPGGVLAGPAESLGNFLFDDVAKAGTKTGGAETKITATTFDGLIIALTLRTRDDGVWAEVSVSAAPEAKPEAAAQAAQITARASGWAYRLQPGMNAALAPALDLLLRDAEAPAPR